MSEVPGPTVHKDGLGRTCFGPPPSVHVPAGAAVFWDGLKFQVFESSPLWSVEVKSRMPYMFVWEPGVVYWVRDKIRFVPDV